MSNKQVDDFKYNLNYDYDKYISKLDELEKDLEDLAEKHPIPVSSGVVSSATWHNEHSQESYEDTQQRLALEKKKRELESEKRDLRSWIDHGLFQRKLTFANGSIQKGGLQFWKWGFFNFILGYRCSKGSISYEIRYW